MTKKVNFRSGVERRALRRELAAAYLDISPSKFDEREKPVCAGKKNKILVSVRKFFKMDFMAVAFESRFLLN
jgi:hypothetical protein